MSFLAMLLFAASVETELKLLNQELIDALASGDRKVIERIYADSFRRVTIDGAVLTKAQILAAFPPKSGASVTYKSEDIQATVYGESAVLIYLSTRDTNRDGVHTYFRYRVSDVFTKIDGRWQKVLSSGTPIIEK